jgi:hypothetical protein
MVLGNKIWRFVTSACNYYGQYYGQWAQSQPPVLKPNVHRACCLYLAQDGSACPDAHMGGACLCQIYGPFANAEANVPDSNASFKSLAFIFVCSLFASINAANF